MRRKFPWMMILLLAGTAQLFAQAPTIGSLVNPPKFKKYAAPVSSKLAFFASDQGKQMLLLAPNPMAKQVLQRYWGSTVAAQWDKTPHQYLDHKVTVSSPAKSVAQKQAAIPLAPVSRCGSTRFNLEGPVDALPQDEESIDFKLGGGSSTLADEVVEVANDFRGFFLSPAIWSPSLTGYYVEDTAGCTPNYEGGTPPISDPLLPGSQMVGRGDPIINYDSIHDAWFNSSIYLGSGTDGVGVFRNTNATLKSTTACPNGTHNLINAINCWPAGPATSGHNAIIVSEQSGSFFADKPDSWVDSRISGIGAGNVYVSDTLFGVGSVIQLTACTNNLTACSVPETISGGDFSTQFSDIKTLANGNVSVTYANFSPSTSSLHSVDIKYVLCTPNGAPVPPTCGAPVLVATDYFPIVAGLTELRLLRNNTYPVHVEAVGGSYVFWEHCGTFSDLPFGSNIICPDADIVGAVNTGSGWSAPFKVDAAAGHQIQPWPTYDSSVDKIVITYQDCDSPLTGRQACRPGYRTITPTTGGSTTVGAFLPLAGYTFPQAEANGGNFSPLFGDYIGASAHGGHYWAGFTDTSRVGTYGFGSALINESNNQLAAVDSP